MKEVSFQLTVEETNLILEALGNLPFVRVYGLINKLQARAQQQLDTNGHATETEVAALAETMKKK